jgi:single-stranded-DNA-specific exonuclease
VSVWVTASSSNANWHVSAPILPPDWFRQALQDLTGSSVPYAATLLWQRGIQEPQQLAQFLSPTHYQPTTAAEFGSEIVQAIDRLLRAQLNQETVAIWGDFDADGITATAVLWEGLKPIFTQPDQLSYFIPNRLTESHGLSQAGLDRLHQQGCQLIITCDTGSTNLPELMYAQRLGIDVIVTDHHTLPHDRPPVAAIVNPRYLAPTHPLATLSGVAVAYKLVEALYDRLERSRDELESLLDLVAIGLIADLVQLTGDCRYLAQRGIQHLQRHTQVDLAQCQRPGIAILLNTCKKSGDRAMDISFGLGPRINAVSRIQGDAHFCVELLTSRDVERCRHLALLTELANTRRKALQRQVAQQAIAKLVDWDLSTTSVIVLEDARWPVGILGLVAGQIAQEYQRPTLLLSTGLLSPDLMSTDPASEDLSSIARGSARSWAGIDLYQLVHGQEHLLERFGGHPLAMGLSLPVGNIPLLTDALNRQLREQGNGCAQTAVLQADLTVKIADLAKDNGKDLFQQLRWLEPYGMGNPVPKLLLENVWFRQIRQSNLKDWTKQPVRFIKTEFELHDDSSPTGFPGLWWGHYQHEIPPDRCDVMVELDFNPAGLSRSGSSDPRYEVRLVAVRTRTSHVVNVASDTPYTLIDRRSSLDQMQLDGIAGEMPPGSESALVLQACPNSWDELRQWYQAAVRTGQPLALAFAEPSCPLPTEIWRQLVGVAKYLYRTGRLMSNPQLCQHLNVSERSLSVALVALESYGFLLTWHGEHLQITGYLDRKATLASDLKTFAQAIQEDQFRQQYFYRLPLTTLQTLIQQT